MGALISTGMTTSVPKMRESGVSPVDLQYDMLMTNSASGSMSDHSFLAAPSFFFSVFLMILLMASTCPLDCRCASDAKKMLML